MPIPGHLSNAIPLAMQIAGLMALDPVILSLEPGRYGPGQNQIKIRLRGGNEIALVFQMGNGLNWQVAGEAVVTAKDGRERRRFTKEQAQELMTWAHNGHAADDDQGG